MAPCVSVPSPRLALLSHLAASCAELRPCLRAMLSGPCLLKATNSILLLPLHTGRHLWARGRPVSNRTGAGAGDPPAQGQQGVRGPAQRACFTEWLPWLPRPLVFCTARVCTGLWGDLYSVGCSQGGRGAQALAAPTFLQLPLSPFLVEEPTHEVQQHQHLTVRNMRNGRDSEGPELQQGPRK